MSQFWNDKIKSISPYVPGEQPKDKKYIKLNTNENPYPPSPNVIKSVKSMDIKSMRLYPDPDVTLLKDEIAKWVDFTDPGMLAMANSGPNTNGSQFFLTMNTLTQLNGQYTIFGELKSREDLSIL